MVMREIEETEFLANQNVVRAVQKMMADPKARRMVQQAQKIVDPSIVIPELDAAAPIEASLAEERTARLALEARMDKDAADRATAEKMKAFEASWNARKASLAKQGYTDEGIVAIEKLAEERGIADLDAAAALFDRLHPPAEPVESAGFGGFNMFESTNGGENEDFKKLIEAQGDDPQAERNMINAALNEVRSAARR